MFLVNLEFTFKNRGCYIIFKILKIFYDNSIVDGLVIDSVQQGDFWLFETRITQIVVANYFFFINCSKINIKDAFSLFRYCSNVGITS